jgi:hypothetical protein
MFNGFDRFQISNMGRRSETTITWLMGVGLGVIHEDTNVTHHTNNGDTRHKNDETRRLKFVIQGCYYLTVTIIIIIIIVVNDARVCCSYSLKSLLLFSFWCCWFGIWVLA